MKAYLTTNIKHQLNFNINHQLDIYYHMTDANLLHEKHLSQVCYSMKLRINLTKNYKNDGRDAGKDAKKESA